MSHPLAQKLTKPAGEGRFFGLNFSKSPEVVAGAEIQTATILAAPDALTIDDPEVSDDVFDGIPAGKAVVVYIAGGEAKQTYEFACKAELDVGGPLVMPLELLVTKDYGS